MLDSFEYPCHGFHDDLPKGKASGQMRIDVAGVHCQFADKKLLMPFTQLHVYLGGASDRLVFFEHPQLAGWSVYTSDRTVLNNPYLKQFPELANKVGRAKNQRRLGWAMGFAALAIIVGIPLFLALRMDLVTEAVAHRVPASWEEELGQSTIAQYRQRNRFMDEKQSEDLLEPLVKPLVNAIHDSRYTYDFYIVDNSTLNAFALPGGDIVIHSSLILRAGTAEELLGVLGHEITHVEEQHGIRNVLGSAGIYILASAVFGDVSGVLSILAGAAPLLLNQSYSRRFESESDEKGYALLKRANIDPSGLARFFNKLIEEEKKRLAEIEDNDTREMVKDALQFLSTHPASEERVQKLQELAQADEPDRRYRNLSAEFKHLQEAVQAFVTENENSKNQNQEDAVNENRN